METVPAWKQVNANILRMVNHIRHDTLVHACIGTITMHVLSKGLRFFHRKLEVKPEIQQNLKVHWQRFTRDFIEHILTYGFALVTLQKSVTLTKVPVLISPLSVQLCFREGKAGQRVVKVMTLDGSAIRKRVRYIEFYPITETGCLTSPTALLIQEYLFHQQIRTEFEKSLTNRGKSLIVLSRKPKKEEQTNSKKNTSRNIAPEKDVLGWLRQADQNQTTTTGTSTGAQQLNDALESQLQRFLSKKSTSFSTLKRKSMVQSQYQVDALNGEETKASEPPYYYGYDETVNEHFLTVNEPYSFTNYLRPEPISDFEHLVVLFEKSVSRVFHLPREFWSENYSTYKSSDNVNYTRLQHTITQWAEFAEVQLNLILQSVYGISDAILNLPTKKTISPQRTLSQVSDLTIPASKQNQTWFHEQANLSDFRLTNIEFMQFVVVIGWNISQRKTT
jgi:hypothetical protein